MPQGGCDLLGCATWPGGSCSGRWGPGWGQELRPRVGSRNTGTQAGWQFPGTQAPTDRQMDSCPTAEPDQNLGHASTAATSRRASPGPSVFRPPPQGRPWLHENPGWLQAPDKPRRSWQGKRDRCGPDTPPLKRPLPSGREGRWGWMARPWPRYVSVTSEHRDLRVAFSEPR